MRLSVLTRRLSSRMILVPVVLIGLTSPIARAVETGCDKADAMWNDKVLPTTYETLPDLSSPGLRDLITFFSAQFVSVSITHVGDELPQGRKKLVHTWGTLARVKFEASGNGGYTGILHSGAPCGIGRFSMAQKPTADTSVPGLALKFFIDGDHDSSNIQVMYSIDGQKGHNFFANSFSNIIPEAKSFATKLISKLFSRGAAYTRAADTAANHLKVTPMADTNADGTEVATVRAPYQLVFQPTEEAQQFMKDATVDNDFRTELGKIPSGTKLYEVYSYGYPDSVVPEYVGSLVTTSPFVAASYGDEKLFFKHTK